MFGVAYQLADLCRLITLEPGDVILTGTPANSRPMKAGDTVEVEISGIGRLTNTIEEWDVDLAGPGEQLQVSAQTLHVALAIPEDEAERMVAEVTGDAGSRPHRSRRLRVADLDEAAARWCLQFGLVERSREEWAGVPRVQRRAVLARAGREADGRVTTTSPSSSHSACSLDDARSAPRRARASSGARRRGRLFVADPDGRADAADAPSRARDRARPLAAARAGLDALCTSAVRGDSGT